MQIVTAPSALIARLQAIKLQGVNIVTNYFPDPAKVQAWIRCGELFSVVDEKAVAILLRRDRDFFHLYFLASGIEALAEALPRVTRQQPAVLTADLIGRDEDLQSMVNLFRQSGFHLHAKLVRLARIAPPDSSSSFQSHPDVVSADQEDAVAVLSLLESNFDRHAEQLPGLEDIRQAVERQEILVIKKDNALAGLLFYEIIGLTSILRYWLVDTRFRDQHVGSRLMHAYFARCPKIRRFILWVIADNDRAIQKYHHYSFATDGLMDQVMIYC